MLCSQLVRENFVAFAPRPNSKPLRSQYQSSDSLSPASNPRATGVPKLALFLVMCVRVKEVRHMFLGVWDSKWWRPLSGFIPIAAPMQPWIRQKAPKSFASDHLCYEQWQSLTDLKALFMMTCVESNHGKISCDRSSRGRFSLHLGLQIRIPYPNSSPQGLRIDNWTYSSLLITQVGTRSNPSHPAAFRQVRDYGSYTHSKVDK